MRRASLRMLGGVALVLALGGALAAGEDRPSSETAILVDRGGACAHGDPRGEGRVALAFAVALAARPGARIRVVAPGLDPAVETDSLGLADLASVLGTIVEPPAPGGADLLPAFKDAAARASLVLAYTSGELDVVGARGEVPAEVLAKAKEKDAHPDRKAVNEAARAMLVEAVAKPLEGKLVALRTPLPDEARSVPFLEALGAKVVELEQPLEATRRLARELGADLPEAASAVLEGGHALLQAPRGSRVVLLGDGPLRLLPRHLVALSDRAFVIDADKPIEVGGEPGTKIGYIVAPRARIELTASAFRLASGAIFVSVLPKDRALVLAAQADGQALERRNDGTLHGKLAATDASSVKLSVGAPGLLPEPEPLAVARALLTVQAAEPPLAGARTKLVARAAGVPADLLPPSVSLSLVSSSTKAAVELARAGDAYQGEATLAEGTWTLEAARAGELIVELAAPLVAKPAGTLTATFVEATKVKDGASSVVVALGIEPALAAPATPEVDWHRGAPSGRSDSKGTARVEGTVKDRARVTVHLDEVEPGPHELAFTVPLGRGAVARAKVSFTLEAAPSWVKPLAASLVALGLLWAFAVFASRRAVERRFALRQLRGLGSNGKMSYERYLLADHREGRWAAVLPPGPTAVKVEIGKDGRVRARALDGSDLRGSDGAKTPEVLLVHETCFLVHRGLYDRRWVYLDRDPSAEELAKRYVPDAPSYDGESRDSDVFVLLDEKENMTPASQRLVPVESERLPRVSDVLKADSDESIVVTDSTEDRVLDDEQAILDPGSDDSTVGDLESSDTTVESSDNTVEND